MLPRTRGRNCELKQWMSTDRQSGIVSERSVQIESQGIIRMVCGRNDGDANVDFNRLVAYEGEQYIVRLQIRIVPSITLFLIFKVSGG